MEDLPWMKPDFDLGKVIASDSSGRYRDALERALGDLSRGLHAQRSIARTPDVADRLDRLMDACDTARAVLEAAHEASQAV